MALVPERIRKYTTRFQIAIYNFASILWHEALDEAMETIDSKAALKTETDAADAATLTSAQGYADAGDAATLTSAQGYADAGDAATLTSAQGYADAGDAATLASAQAYTDANSFSPYGGRGPSRFDRYGAASSSVSFGAVLAVDEDWLFVGLPTYYLASNGSGIFYGGAVFVYRFNSQTGQYVLHSWLVAPVRYALERFGEAVAVDGGYAAIGATGHQYDENDANPLTNAGCVYLFKYDADSDAWVYLHKFVASGTNARNAEDKFGSAVSIAVSGSYVGVSCGAPYHGYDASGADYKASAGAVFAYLSGNDVDWTVDKIVATGTNARNANDLFGWALGQWGLGSLVVGAPQHGYDAAGADYKANAGAGFNFWTSPGPGFSLRNKLVASGTNGRNSGDKLGYSVGGMYPILLGSPYHGYDAAGADYKANAGAVYRFDSPDGALLSKLVASGTNGRNAYDLFGSSVATDGFYTIIGAPQHGYDAAGADLQSNAGAAFVFNYALMQYKIVGKGTNGRNADDKFGTGVAMYRKPTNERLFFCGAPDHDYLDNGVDMRTSIGAVYYYVDPGSISWLRQKL